MRYGGAFIARFAHNGVYIIVAILIYADSIYAIYAAPLFDYFAG